MELVCQITFRMQQKLVTLLLCCWLRHLKMSFYYPTSHSILLVHYSMIELEPAIFYLNGSCEVRSHSYLLLPINKSLFVR